MEVTREIEEFRSACADARILSPPIGFVPTMGALHEGHASLLRAARETSGTVAMSIFVNPMQFGPAEDLQTYPRDLARDLDVAEREGVDLVFAPSVEQMYPHGSPSVTVDPGPLGDVLEGATRPGHFRGVCTVVSKLFSIVGPCTSYFGEKDAQQLAVVRRMVADLDLPVDVVACPTVRERDGLALSSRNARLSPEERRAATCLQRALTRAVELVEADERDAARIRAAMREVIETEPLAKLDYATVVDEETFQEVEKVAPAGSWRISVGSPSTEEEWVSLDPPDEVVPLPSSRALVAAGLGQTRLIDNMPLP